ncbi:hypothetical protein EV127DRAFT_419070 [Xylaria flabelliformis]|nr:hypothetical protein EV127DRAFT_419070 [Xylaria flabelliformis]
MAPCLLVWARRCGGTLLTEFPAFLWRLLAISHFLFGVLRSSSKVWASLWLVASSFASQIWDTLRRAPVNRPSIPMAHDHVRHHGEDRSVASVLADYLPFGQQWPQDDERVCASTILCSVEEIVGKDNHFFRKAEGRRDMQSIATGLPCLWPG